MATTAIEVRSMCAGYDGRSVVRDLSMTIQAGEIVALIGPNGAGKSTVLKALCGVLRCYSGCVQIFGKDLTKRGADVAARLGLAYIPQGGRVFEPLSVRDNLLVGLGGRATRTAAELAIENAYALFSGLRVSAALPAGLLSAGERQMVALARGFLVGTRILLVDEPTGGLAPPVAVAVLDALRLMRETSQRTLVIVEQNIAYALAIADRVYGMKLGKLEIAGLAVGALAPAAMQELYM